METDPKENFDIVDYETPICILVDNYRANVSSYVVCNYLLHV